MRKLLFVAISMTLMGCGSLVKREMNYSMVSTGVRAVTKSSAEIRQAVPIRRVPGATEKDCEMESRAYWFVTNMPVLSELHAFDLYITQKAREQRPDLLKAEPKQLGKCVANPFAKEIPNQVSTDSQGDH